MKIFNLSTALLLFASILVQSCVYIDADEIEPQGPVNTISINVGGFDQVRASDALEVHIMYGTTQKVEANGSDRDLDALDIRVENNRLIADFKDSWFGSRRRVDLYLTMPDLVAVDLSGAADADIRGFVDLLSLDIKASGASDVDFSGFSRKLYFELRGASELDVRGTGVILDGKLNGASKLNALEYQVDEAYLNLSGASTAKVWANDKLDVHASGASTVRYKGAPNVTKDLSGGSNVRED